MKYIGNEARWITDEMMLLLQNNAGSKLPVWSPDRFRGHPLLDKIRSAGEEYFKGTIPNNFFHVFYSRTDCMENFNFILPNLIPPQESVVWWFSKLNPGEYQFTHYPAYDLDLFSGYRIKIVMSGTNQAQPPRIKELRTIAIR